MDLAQTLGWIATMLFSVMIIPQMIKTVKTKDTKGVSVTLFIIYLIGNIIALVYALLIFQPPLIFKYTVGILITSIYIGIYINYSRRNRLKNKSF